MDYVYILIGVGVMLLSCLLEYRMSSLSRNYLFYLPLLFAILTFWFGFIALLFAFALIFIGELAPRRGQEEHIDGF